MPHFTKKHIVSGVSGEVQWWIKERLKKFRKLKKTGELADDTIAINPFMAPLLVGIHSHADFDELAEFLLAAHFFQGHSTGFGKLVDEKILPRVFGSTKLNKKFRKKAPYSRPVFSEIDHILDEGSDDQVLLSLKASRWTIQLTMSERMNHSFQELLELRESGEVSFSQIVVGVIYGTEEGLTDKFDIIRGICSGAEHDVKDITDHVQVMAGRNLWTWVNGGEERTQEWIMEGLLDGLTQSRDALSEAAELIRNYKRAFSARFDKYIDPVKGIDWFGILTEING